MEVNPLYIAVVVFYLQFCLALVFDEGCYHKRQPNISYWQSCFYRRIIRYDAAETLNSNDSEFVQTMSINGKFDRIIMGISCFVALAAVLGVIASISSIDSLAQTDLTTATTGPIQDQERSATTPNTTSVIESFGEPFFVEQGRITGQRVLAVAPQPQLEFSFMANASINNGDDGVVNAINTGTSISTLNADGTFRGEGQGILRTQGGGVATWTNQVVGSITPEGTIITRGVGIWSTPSTMGELGFMNNMITVFEVQIDREGNLSAREWEWR